MIEPGLEQPYELSSRQVEDFRRDGHICLRNVCSLEEAAYWREVIRDATYEYNRETRPLEERDDYGKAFLQVTNLWEQDKRVRPFTLAKRFGRIVAQLMDCASVRLYHDQALFKEAGGGPTAWHQDQTYMPFDSPNLIGMWMALTPVPLEVGSMRFVSGSHKLGWLGPMPFSAEADLAVQQVVRQHVLRYCSYGAMDPGDVTLHSAWTLHSAAGNPTANTREIMNLFYLDGAARITPPLSETHEIGLKYNVGSRSVGELPDTEHNPIVYP